MAASYFDALPYVAQDERGSRAAVRAEHHRTLGDASVTRSSPRVRLGDLVERSGQAWNTSSGALVAAAREPDRGRRSSCAYGTEYVIRDDALTPSVREAPAGAG
ncbi:hypothetical protein GCM10023238_15690 [Streptomyces heliomycini]